MAEVEFAVLVEPKVIELLHPVLLDFLWAPLMVLVGKVNVWVFLHIRQGLFHNGFHFWVSDVDVVQLGLVEIASGTLFN